MILFGIPASVLLLVSIVLIRRRNRMGLLSGVIAGGLLVAAFWYHQGVSSDPSDGRAAVRADGPPRLPKQDLSGGYTGAASCRECHPNEHASWHRSFHRSMTQAVTPETMTAPLGDVALESRGRPFRLWREDDTFWVEMVDPEWDLKQKALGHRVAPADGPRVQRQIVMLTGSHHYQTYWINGTKGNQLWQVPWVYHFSQKRWLPVEDTILNPPSGYRRLTDWNDACIQCHAVRPKPGLDDHGVFDTRVVDLGIACEACHGPGRNHVDFQKSRPDSIEIEKGHDESIVNSARLTHDRSSQVCGQCHGLFAFNKDDFLRSEFAYRPGDDLYETRGFHDFHDEATQSQAWLQDAFWRDGSVRVPGAEYSAIRQTACFQSGTLSCLSCHSLHEYESPDDLLTDNTRSDQACLKCHQTYSEDLSSHTHHASESSGSRCYNCHMPHSSIGLQKGIRSHQIDIPTASMTIDHGRPNACNLCHTDRTLRWTSDHLASWYGHQPVKTSKFAEENSTAVIMLISGDAVQRAITAWNLGRLESRNASGDDWQVPLTRGVTC